MPRSKRSPLFINKRLSLKSGQRTVYDWLPVFHYSEQEVFQGIVDAGQDPFHVYGIENVNGVATRVRPGNTRTSCRCCIMGNKNDLTNGANWYPDSYAMTVALERVVGHTMFSKKVKGVAVPVSLTEKTSVQVDEVAVRRWMMVLANRRENLLKKKQAELEEKALRKKEKLVSVKNVDTQTLSLFM